MPDRPVPVLALLAFAAMLSSGCTGETAPKYTHATVRTYAELLLFHEKQKMIGMIPDSTYQNRLRIFFAERKIDERDFENQITQISRDGTAWRSFLAEATVVVDSIRTTKPS